MDPERLLLQVPVDGLQGVLELGDEPLLAALQSLAVLHSVLQRLEDAADAGAERLDAANGVREGVQVHPHGDRLRHVAAAAGEARLLLLLLLGLRGAASYRTTATMW